ncbi:MAG: hypothetical protein AAB611_03330, partial [Patescibacteria group bacterium]
MNIIGYRKIYYSISATVILVSFLVIGLWGFKLGIDFTGGSSWQVRASNIDATAVTKLFNENGVSSVLVERGDGDERIFRFQEVTAEKHQQLTSQLKNVYPDFVEEQFSVIGPTISGELREKAMFAIIFVLFGISLYIALVFRQVSRPLPSWV